MRFCSVKDTATAIAAESVLSILCSNVSRAFHDITVRRRLQCVEGDKFQVDSAASSLAFYP